MVQAAAVKAQCRSAYRKWLLAMLSKNLFRLQELGITERSSFVHKVCHVAECVLRAHPRISLAACIGRRASVQRYGCSEAAWAGYEGCVPKYCNNGRRSRQAGFGVADLQFTTRNAG